ncbi:MAG: valine--tRNA ligase, partial [Candidatus Nanoarchaeia archaeon]|nr:valine--tRNA ligase [Candidatus Nanoarchaeia archaeon]
MEPKIKENRWNKDIEAEIKKFWLEKKLNDFDPKIDKPVFSIDTPPPYPSGKPWHIGATAHYSMIDTVARTGRMSGFNVLFPTGIDRNGLPVELYTEKKNNISMHKIPREEFVKLCAESLDDLEAYMIEIMQSFGWSGDMKKFRYRTDSPEYRKLTQETFIELWNKGLIYEDTRPNNYDIKTRTTIADAEIEYQDIQTKLVYLKFRIKETGRDIIIATTRPELIFSCAAVLYNPSDERYNKLGKKTVVTPIGDEVPLIAHPYAKVEFGSGVVMICSYGDYADVRIFRELKLKEKICIDENGRMNKNAGKYAGLNIKEAREEIIKEFKNENKVDKIEEIMHRTPMSERGKCPIEIIPMKEWYLKQMEFKDVLRKFANEIKFHPEDKRQILLDWIESVSMDWPITRRRFYGTEVPIWYCKKCNTPHVPKPGKYYQPWKDAATFKKCEKCGNEEFVGDSRTFDTWMDSSISALFISGYKRDEELFAKAFPVTIRPQAKEIIRTWLYYTMLRTYLLTGKNVFKHVWVSGHGVDEHGVKMSKSLGNVVDPVPVIEKYGGDAFRFWNMSEATLGSDFRYSEDKIQSAQKFLTKLWNISRFISMFPVKKTAKELQPADRWVLAELNKAVAKSAAGYGDFNFFVPANEMKQFSWNIFADHYLEMVKARAYNNDLSALYTLHYCLQSIIKMLAPISPFITEKVWLSLYSKESIHLEEFPKPNKKAGEELCKLTDLIIKTNSEIWKFKKEKGLALNSELKKVILPESLRDFSEDLKSMHRI